MALITSDAEVAAQFLRGGKLVAIPTETVYGLAGNALDEKAVASIFSTKQRPHFDPLILHFSDLAEIEKYTLGFIGYAQSLASAFWPGPLTLVLRKQPVVPYLCTAGLDSVAVRVPNHPLTLALLQKLDFPLAAPSANPFGRTSPTTAEHVQQMLGHKIDCILDGGPCKVGLESSIVSCLGDIPELLRYGGLSTEQIESVTGPLKISVSNNSNPSAPGQLDAHYSPQAPLVLLNCIDSSFAEEAKEDGFFIFFKRPSYETGNLKKLILSELGNEVEAAANLFSAIHEADATEPKTIFAELAPSQGLGLAINDRLKRAAAK